MRHDMGRTTCDGVQSPRMKTSGPRMRAGGRRHMRGVLGLAAMLLACVEVADPPVSASIELQWSHTDPAASTMQPFADDDIAVFGNAFVRRVVALDAKSGSMQWELALPGGPSGLALPSGNILSTGEFIIVSAWELFALDPATGSIRWRVDAVVDEYPAGSAIALVGDVLVTPGSFRHISAIDAGTGTVLWSTDLGERPFAPIVDDDVVYVGTRGYFENSSALRAGHAVALRLSDGHVLWKTPIPDAVGSPWLGGTDRRGALTDDLFIVSSTNGRIYGFDRSDGHVQWERAGFAPYQSGVALLGDVAVVASLDGEYTGLDANTGEIRWSTSFGGSSVSHQITTDGVCAFITVGGVSCMDEAGRRRWLHGGASNGGPSYTTPASAVGDLLYIGSTTGFHALRYR